MCKIKFILLLPSVNSLNIPWTTTKVSFYLPNWIFLVKRCVALKILYSEELKYFSNIRPLFLRFYLEHCVCLRPVSKTNEAAPGAEGIDEDGYPSHFRQIINLNRKGGKRGAKIILQSALLILSIPSQRTIRSRRQFHLTWRWVRFIITRNSFQYCNIL